MPYQGLLLVEFTQLFGLILDNVHQVKLIACSMHFAMWGLNDGERLSVKEGTIKKVFLTDLIASSVEGVNELLSACRYDLVSHLACKGSQQPSRQHLQNPAPRNFSNLSKVCAFCEYRSTTFQHDWAWSFAGRPSEDPTGCIVPNSVTNIALRSRSTHHPVHGHQACNQHCVCRPDDDRGESSYR